jgi:DNA-binding GntR family transcriptional regulator
MPLPASFGSLSRTNARQAVHQLLLDSIVFGPLEPGEPLRDTEIAELLGVSRTPVREALLRLSEQGLVEIQPGRGTRVAPLRFDRAAELFAIAGVLDGLAAELATPTLPTAKLDELRSLVERMSRAAEAAELQRLDEQFHAIYYAASGNEGLAEMLSGITVELRRYDRVGFRNPAIVASSTSEHRTILEAFVARDPAKASASARINWTHPWSQIESLLTPGEVERMAST